MFKVLFQISIMTGLLFLAGCQSSNDQQKGQAPVGHNSKATGIVPVTPEVNYPALVRVADLDKIDYNNLPYVEPRTEVRRPDGIIPEELAAQFRAESLNLAPNNNIQVSISPEDGLAQGPAPLVPQLLNTFDGPQFTSSTPPDHEFTVGESYVIGVTNGSFEILDKTGVSQGGATTYNSFFSGVAACASGTFDPNAYYDEEEQRYIIGTAGAGVYCFGVSQSEDLSGGGTWNTYGFTTVQDGSDFFDYPHMGVGNEALFMGANIFGTFRADVWAIDKFAAYAGDPLPTPVRQTLDSTTDTPQPMNVNGFAQGTLPQDNTHYFITDSNFDGNNFALISWEDPFGANIITNTGVVDLGTFTGVPAGFPIDQPQGGGGSDIQGNDWRVQDAEYRNGSIWMAHTIACNPGSGTVNCVRWAEIDPNDGNGPIIEQAGVISIDGEFLSFPDVAVNACEDMTIGFARTSPSIFPGVAFTGRLGTDPLNQVNSVQIQKAGEVVYQGFDAAPRRWGDYSEAASDPDGERTWFLGVYSADNNSNTNWVTNVGEFTTSCDAGTYSVGGTTNDLALGNTVTLQNNLTDDLVVVANGPFTFSTELSNSDPFSVTVLNQPETPNQFCEVTNGTGSINQNDVNTIVVDCVTEQYSVGGGLNGLALGNTVTIQNNGVDSLVLSEDGPFEFVTALDDGTGFEVTVLTDPTTPNQTCEVTNGDGTLSGDDVNNVSVTCSLVPYTVGGDVAGLLVGQSLTLQNSNSDDLLISDNGAFVFATAVGDGNGYDVSVLVDPTEPNQTCLVTAGSGLIAGANVTDVSVACTINTYTVGGDVVGLLPAQTMTLQNNGGDDLVLAADNSFVFAVALNDGTDYEVTATVDPVVANQQCLVVNGEGTLSGSDVVDVKVVCAEDSYTVGGNLAGLLPSQNLTLQVNGGDDLFLEDNGLFVFSQELLDGLDYAVTVSVNPTAPNQICSVTNGEGTVSAGNVIDVVVSCSLSYTIGGNLTGLIDGLSVTLQNNGVDDLELTGNGPFQFNSELIGLDDYDVTVLSSPTSPIQNCTITNGDGVVAATNISDVVVTCDNLDLIFKDGLEINID